MRGLLLSAIFALRSSLALAQSPIAIQIDWDAETPKAHQIFAIESFREAFPNIEFSHMINPKVFLSADQLNSNKALIQRVVKSNDEVGLYVSASKKICEEAQVFYRDQPTFWSFDSLKACDDQCDDDVPLSVYSDAELRKMISASLDNLRKEGFPNVNRVKFHGYIMNKRLLKISRELGLTPYLTAIDPNQLTDEMKRFPLMQFMKESWEDYQDDNVFVPMDLMSFQKSAELIQKRGEQTTVTVSIQTFESNEFRLRQILKGPANAQNP